MAIRKFAVAEAVFERSPKAGWRRVHRRRDRRAHGAPITIGFGRYLPNERLTETMRVDDVMVVLQRRPRVSTSTDAVTAGPGEIAHMPKGETVTIDSREEDAVTAYVTYPHRQDPVG
jgi:ethanolamine utilization protein EutQ (cupin superfamily)